MQLQDITLAIIDLEDYASPFLTVGLGRKRKIDGFKISQW